MGRARGRGVEGGMIAQIETGEDRRRRITCLLFYCRFILLPLPSPQLAQPRRIK